ncbi:PREDICTED: uncharacterized protein LOC105454043 [Wasmannia auropunctata]|uniref:uncharacterized protein LOC105454043 n=1 Tax=Wasmannia auropunctata TaxID=64793 RepID=UPI0005EFED99|nr:PREDICTED: uncharacterized protein LOC105454043 [Wasmannia auropunctata]
MFPSESTSPLRSTISPSLKLGLGLIGMWPGSSGRTFLWFFYMATLLAMQYFQYSYFFAYLGANDLSKLMERSDGLSITLDYTLTFLKLLSLWHNRRIFSDILGAMNDDWNDCPTDSHACMMTDKAILAHRCSNVMIGLNSVSCVVYFIGSYLSRRTVSTDFREFPLQVRFPFNATYSPIFELVVLGLFFHVWETAAVIALLNSLILALVSQRNENFSSRFMVVI